MARSGEIAGGIHPYIGQEAVAAGCCAALRADDVITSTHRGHGHVLAKGADPGRLLAELAGRATGLNRGRGGSMHAADVSLGVLGANGIVGAGAPIAVGAAWAARQAGADRVAMSFFGEGAVNQGVLLEALNLAALQRAAVVFVCENNGYAMTLPVQSGTAGRSRREPRPSASTPPLWMEWIRRPYCAAATEAVDRARGGSGPVFLESLTYRFDAHHTRDHRLRLRYRTDDEVARWRTRDPVLIQGQRLRAAARERIDQEVESVIADATTFARSSPAPESGGALDFLYATGLRPRMGMV